MTIQYINVAVGSTLANGDVGIVPKGKNAGTQASHVSLAYDDSVVTKKNQLLAAVRTILTQVASDSSLT